MTDVSAPSNAIPVALSFLAHEAPPVLEVLGARLTAGLSQLFDLTLLVQTDSADLALGSLLRQPVAVRFTNESFLPEVRGIIVKARAVTIEPSGRSRYELVVVPPVWLLSKRRNHRIFADQSVLDIAAILLAEHGIDSRTFVPRPIDAPRKRQYTVQYGETDLHLIERLLADDNCVYYFDFAKQSEWVVIQDSAQQCLHVDCRLPLLPAGGLVVSGPAALSCEPRVETTFASAAIRDYDWMKPAYIIDGNAAPPASLSSDRDLEWYEYEVGEVGFSEGAKTRAQATVAANVNASRRLSIRSTVLLSPATRFWVDGSPRHETEHALLIVSSVSTWECEASSQTTLVRHDLLACSAGNNFRPQRLEKPRIHGVQTGLVVGPAGQEIDVDEHGRVEVEFRWDRRDLHGPGASRRVRVSQGWAGIGYGIVALPRVNDEVVVAFLDGDPDEPLIVGRLHNPARPSPLNLPEDATVTTWRSRSSPGGEGYNEILMDDLAGKERLQMHAQLDFSKVVERDAKERVGRNLDLEVRGDTTSNITGTSSHAAGVASHISAPDVGVNAENLTLFGRRTELYAETRQDSIDSTFMVSAGAEYTTVKDVFQINGKHFDVFCGGILRVGEGKIELIVGDSSIRMTSGEITIVSPLINLNP